MDRPAGTPILRGMGTQPALHRRAALVRPTGLRTSRPRLDAVGLVVGAVGLGTWGAASSSAATPAATPAAAQEAAEASGENVLKLTLADALRIAVAENLTLSIEDRAVEQARANSLGSWGAFDPVFDLTGSYSESDEPQQNLFFSQGVSSSSLPR